MGNKGAPSIDGMVWMYFSLVSIYLTHAQLVPHTSVKMAPKSKSKEKKNKKDKKNKSAEGVSFSVRFKFIFLSV